MARKIAVLVDGETLQLSVTESLGYNADVGGRVNCVMHEGKERKAVQRGGVWRLWGAQDRVQPLIEHIEREARAGRTWP